jgi:hypothetical protein
MFEQKGEDTSPPDRGRSPGIPSSSSKLLLSVARYRSRLLDASSEFWHSAAFEHATRHCSLSIFLSLLSPWQANPTLLLSPQLRLAETFIQGPNKLHCNRKGRQDRPAARHKSRLEHLDITEAQRRDRRSDTTSCAGADHLFCRRHGQQQAAVQGEACSPGPTRTQIEPQGSADTRVSANAHE